MSSGQTTAATSIQHHGRTRHCVGLGGEQCRHGPGYLLGCGKCLYRGFGLHLVEQNFCRYRAYGRTVGRYPVQTFRVGRSGRYQVSANASLAINQTELTHQID